LRSTTSYGFSILPCGLFIRSGPTAQGMPLEIHCFSTTSAWTDDEEIQADIIEHLLAILPEFHLRRYQAPGGRCLTETQLEPATAAPEVPRLHTRISPAAPNI